MRHSLRERRSLLGRALVGVLLGLGASRSLHGATTDELRITVSVVVTDAETGQPVNQAHLTLQFFEQRKLKFQHPKMIAYSAKTNSQGQCKFVGIPEGTIHLIVTEERHQTFGKDFEVTKDRPALEVKLKPPQPLL